VNWSTGVVPSTSATDAVIDDRALQNSVVTLDQSVATGNLTIDAGDSLLIESGFQASTRGTNVGGTILLDGMAILVASEYLWIQPSGQLQMPATPLQLGSQVRPLSGPLLNQGIVSGAGRITDFSVLTNEGRVIGDIAGKSLSLPLGQGFHRNAGELLATDGGMLVVGQPILINPISNVLHNFGLAGDGLIQARGGSSIDLQSMTVLGGEISTAAGEDGIHGQVRLTNVILNGTRLVGDIVASRLTFQNTIENNAKITSTGAAPFITVSGPATLTGNGRLELRQSVIQGAGNFVNDTQHTIAGPGTINAFPSGFTFLNRGVVEAIPGETSELVINLPGSTVTTNSGIMRARDGATLRLQGLNFTTQVNFEQDDAGVIEAGVDSTVRLWGGYTIRGGTLRSVAPESVGSGMAGKFETVSSNPLLRDVRLEGAIGDEFSHWRITGEIENTGEFSGDEILVDGAATLTGGGTVRFVNGTALYYGTTPSVFTNEDNLLVGTGRIDVGTNGMTFVNRGTVEAQGFTGMQIQGGTIGTPYPVTNSGLLQASANSKIEFRTTVLNQEGANLGTILAKDNALIFLGSVTGGVLATEGTGEIRMGTIAGTALIDVHNQGLLRILGSTYLGGVIRNDGTITNNSGVTTTFAGAGARLEGTGSLGTTGTAFSIVVGNDDPTVFVNGANHTVRGYGTLRVSKGVFVNEGTLLSDGAATLKVVLDEGTSMQQRGLVQVQSGRRLEIETWSESFANRGTIDVAGEIMIRRVNGGSLEFHNTSGAQIFLRGTIELRPSNAFNNTATLWNKAGATIAGSGAFELAASSQPESGLLRNSGLLRPEGEVAELGRIYLDGDFQQDATGTLEMNVAGIEPGQFDALILSASNATLGGALDIYPLATFDPPVGHMYTLVDTQGGTVTGTFDTFTAPALSGRWWSLNYLADKVVLSVEAITADFNLDGVVNEGDLAVWQTASGIDGSADADGDGDTDGRDFLMWQRQYGGGVSVAEAASVPEPTCFALSTIIVLILAKPRGYTPWVLHR
jgi:hypothetical protein